MPIIKSAKKRVRTSNKAAIRNSKVRRNLKVALKEFDGAITSKKSKDIDQAYKNAHSAIDIAVKKHVIHKNKAARKKSQLSVKIKSIGIKLESTPKKSTKKAPAPKKKPAVKKAKKTTK